VFVGVRLKKELLILKRSCAGSTCGSGVKIRLTKENVAVCSRRLADGTVLGEIINEAGLLTVMHIMMHINAYNLAYREEQS
jgi:hypothetical protein